MSEHSLADWYAALGAAIRANDMDAVPGLLTLMALDGFGHEAEQWRRDTLAAMTVLNAEGTSGGGR